ncbi:putative glucose dehydrogenase [Stachybotrys elegans]|uniref:Glucose dehydrogenase n=1 Tax=Stachybotrys elegans TaxID=80388 RepID=A0A8K0WJD7_9HYPO|nr:putative glucose dehydrogenase [Stachybotrys elegans]
MGLFTQLPTGLAEVDVIVAGGGTAGCVVASRLSEADPDLSILVLEGGPNNTGPTIGIPALFHANLDPATKTNLFYPANKSDNIGGRVLHVPSGGLLGGGSSTNLMMYSRGQRSDYDSWKTPGWSADEFLPFMKKLETYHGPGDRELHGYDGPIHVSRGTYNSTITEDQFIAAAEALGRHETKDLQSMDAINATERALHYISPDGKRQDAASCYLHPLLEGGKNPNLTVVLESQVIRILLDDDKTATGVEFITNPAFQPGEHHSQVVKARKLVVLSCGALGTPAVLERSGLGCPKVLEKAGITLSVDLPGVGHEYEDHHLLTYPYKTSLGPEETLDPIAQGRIDFGDLIKNQDPRLGWNGMDIAAKIRPTDDEVASLGPEFQEAWDSEFKTHPDRPLVILSGIGAFAGDPRSVEPGQYFSVTCFTPYPFSRGHVHVTGPDVSDPLDFDTGFFSNPLDIKKHIWAYKTQREIVRRMKVYRGEVAAGHPPFPAHSSARCITLDAELHGDIKNIEYSAEDDTILEQWLRENVNTTWHSLGTAKMRPLDQNGVVDGSLSVYKTKKLKIADLSIVPSNVAANTNNTALAIGEKAADILIKELGIEVA